MYKFDISGFTVNSRGEDMKKQARRAAHQVKSDEEVVETCGPFSVEDKRGKTVTRHLTRHELVFGLKGFGGLTSWWGKEDGTGEVTIDSRAKLLGGVSEWIVDFVRQVILTEAVDHRGRLLKPSWGIIQEEDLSKRYMEF